MNKICNYIIIIFSILLSLAGGCDEGISPEEGPIITEAHGIKGTLRFANWPPPDSIIDLRLVAFINYPPVDIISEVIHGRAKYTDKLPYGVDSINYTLILNPLPVDTIRCIAVGQQFGNNIEEDWRLVGLYYTPGDSVLPGRVFVPPDSIVANINIRVDFKKLPPQP